MFKLGLFWLPGLLLCSLLACNTQPQEDTQPERSAPSDWDGIFGTPPPAARWYSPEQVKLGEQVYTQHCQVCHLPQGRGPANWREPLADGRYPPPPLDGSAHAWHHPLADLLNTINLGSQSQGGQMPAFEKTLSEAEKQAVIAYFQSLWSEEIYALWHARINGD